jgi:hypothetical protein
MKSSNDIHRLLNDRVEFRLHAAEHHLEQLKEIQSIHGSIAKEQARLEVEMEIDCFLSQVIGAVDSLLYQINNAFDLGVPDKGFSLQQIQSALSAKTKHISLLNELDEARQPGHWYSVLYELRNQSMHRTFLRKVIITHAFEEEPVRIKFLQIQQDIGGNPFEHEMNEEIIPYLEKSLEQVRSLISGIRKSVPILQPS